MAKAEIVLGESGGSVEEVNVTLVPSAMGYTLNQNNTERVYDVVGVNTLSLTYVATNNSGGCQIKDENGVSLQGLASASTSKTVTQDISGTNQIRIGNYGTGSWSCTIQQMQVTNS